MSTTFVSGKNRVYLIALAHMSLVVLGIYSLVKEQLNLQDNFYLCDCLVLFTHYFIHFFLIYTLVLAVYKGIPLLLIPWTLSAFVILTYLTGKVLLAFGDIRNDAVLYLVNFLYLSIYWYLLYTVYVFFKKWKKVRYKT